MGVVELANPSSPTQKYKQNQMYGWKRLGVAEREKVDGESAGGVGSQLKLASMLLDLAHTPKCERGSISKPSYPPWKGGGSLEWRWVRMAERRREADGGDEGRGESKTSF